METIITSAGELPRVAQTFLEATTKKPKGVAVLALYGELGAGKTSFVQALARELGVAEIVTSPTFVIEKLYDTKHPVFKKLVHIDAYRLKDKGELESLKWRELLADSDNLIALEWADRVEGLLPKDVLRIRFSVIDDKTRTISY